MACSPRNVQPQDGGGLQPLLQDYGVLALFSAQEPQALVVDSTPSPDQHHGMLGESQNHFQLDERRRGD
jgi:hypothetical protein